MLLAMTLSNWQLGSATYGNAGTQCRAAALLVQVMAVLSRF